MVISAVLHGLIAFMGLFIALGLPAALLAWRSTKRGQQRCWPPERKYVSAPLALKDGIPLATYYDEQVTQPLTCSTRL